LLVLPKRAIKKYSTLSTTTSSSFILNFKCLNVFGYELTLGTSWFGYELVLGTGWLGYGLALGTSWLRYELARYELVWV